ncbi:STAS domain-containing protein [Phosphitispora fastidiosa]|uniref:STAS domain-containing protein n=1 Tax=Phosphitispora fastidiosa TaxID=2837202 RepID=UPI001E61FE77|nr:STAS domain-containing protein [Phosphitispora fastidiosa]MBU7007953.1 anti-anti-sigma factor [Phosphitispora fastidiosa]
MLEIETSNGKSLICLKLSGELEISTVEQLRLCVERLCLCVERLPDGLTEVHLDFLGIEFVDSTGIGTLINVMKDLREQDIKVMVTRIPKEIYEVFDLLSIPELMGEDSFECLS